MSSECDGAIFKTMCVYPVSRLQSELIVQSSSGSLSSGSAVAAFSIQLRVHSSRGRNTTPLSHLADVASAPSLSLSLSLWLNIQLVSFTAGPVGRACVCARCRCQAVYCVRSSRRGREGDEKDAGDVGKQRDKKKERRRVQMERN